MIVMGGVGSGRARVRQVALGDDLNRLSSRMAGLRRARRLDCPGKNTAPARRIKLGLV